MQYTVGVFTTDEDLIIKVWDAALARLTAVSAEKVSGRPLTTVLPDLEERRLLPRFQRVLNEGVVEVLATAFHHYLIPCPPLTPSKRFDKMQQLVTIAPLREDNRIRGLIVTVEDVTELLDRERDLVQQLTHSDETARLHAAEILSQDEALPSGESLLPALRDTSWRVRRVAVEGVSKRAAPHAIAALLSSVRGDHHNLSLLNSALQVLALTDVDTFSPLIEFLNDSDPDLRLQAALALGEQRDQRAVAPLMDALKDTDINVRYHVIEALGKLRAIEAAEALASIAATREFFLAFPALDALMQIGDARVVSRIVPLLDDELLREPAAVALGKLGDEQAVDPLVNKLNTTPEMVQAVAESLTTLYDRYDKLYSEGRLIADLSRCGISAAGAKNLLDALDQAAPEKLRAPALVMGWLEGPAVDQALTRLLGHESARNDVIEALVRHGSRVTTLLIEQLHADDLEVRRSAAVALGRIGDAKATTALIEILDDEGELIIPTVNALAKIGDQRAFEALLSLIGHSDAVVRQAVTGALNSLGSPQMPTRIVPLLSDPDPNVRESAVKIAGYFGFPECAELLLDRCHDQDERVRRAAIEHLPFLQDERVVDTLAHSLRHETPRVRASAASAIAHVESPRVESLLSSALDDEDSWVRYFAARALGTRRFTESVAALERVVQTDGSTHVRIAALEALGQIGGERAVKIAATFVESTDSDLANAALAALGNIPHHAATEPLVKSLRFPQADRRRQAAVALGQRRNPEVLEHLERLAAADDQPDVIAAAMVALGELATPEAIAGLIALTADPVRRDAACSALANVPDSLLEQVARGLSHPSAEVRRAIVGVLARMKRRKASELLRNALGDPDASVRLAAADAVGKTYQSAKTTIAD
jgi:HEAT repeat protein